MDLIASTIHGRPAATEHHRPSSSLIPAGSALRETGDVALLASYELSTTVSSIVNDLYSSSNIKASTADSYLRSLQIWLSELPPSLKLSSVNQYLDTEVQQQVIGSLHLSAYYYHVVMLVTRPFMIAHLIKKLAAHKQNPEGKALTMVKGVSDSETTMLAHACTNAAIYLAQTVYQVHQQGRLVPTMPLIE